MSGRVGENSRRPVGEWTPRTAALRRIREEWGLRLRFVRNVVDWTVALYIVIPAAIYFGITYASWWREAPEWLAAVPEPLLVAAIGLIAASGGLRALVRRADALFLLQRGEWLRRLRAWGAGYAVLLAAGTSALWFALPAPLAIVGFGLDGARFAALCALAFALKLLRMAVRIRLQTALAGWRRDAAVVFVSAAVLAGYAAIALTGADTALVFAAAAAVLPPALAGIRAFIRSGGGFHALAEYEAARRAAGFEAVYQGHIGNPPSRRAKPWWLRRSDRLPLMRLAGAGAPLADVLVKAIVRRPSQVLGQLQFLGVGYAAITMIAVPPVRLFVAAVLILLLLYWQRLQVAAQLANPFLAMHPYPPLAAASGASTAAFLLAAPGAAWFGALAGIAWGVWAAAAGAVIGLAALYFAASLAPPSPPRRRT